MEYKENDAEVFWADSYKNCIFLERLKNAVKYKKVVLFVGAGVSKLCGLPLWHELATRMLNLCADNKSCSFTYKDKELLTSSINDSRELMTIAANIMGKIDGAIFYETLKNNLIVDKKKTNKIELENYETIPKILKSFANTIITTNADTIIDDEFGGKTAILYKESDISKMKLSDRQQVFHIHGSINNPYNMIFKTSDYLKRYNDKIFRKSIANIFNDTDPNSVILIIGYSLSELQLLDFIIRDDANKEDRAKKLFLLNGYYSYQRNVFEAEKEYYAAYGITLLSYNKDSKDYQGLVDALKYLDDYTSVKSEKNMNKIENICNIFNKRPTEKVFDDFLNCFDTFDDRKKSFAFSELLKSQFLYNWISEMFNNDKCYKKYLSIPENLQEMSNGRSDFPACKMLMQLKCHLAKNKKELIEYFDELTTEVYNNDSYIANSSFCIPLCKAILTNIEYISLPPAYEFVKKINETEYSHYWILFLCYQNDILLKTSKKVFSEYLMLALNYFYYQKDDNYIFDNFYNTYGQRIKKDAPLEVFKICKNKIEKSFKSYSDTFVIRDCFEIIKKDSNYDFNYNYKEYKILILFLEGVDDKKAINYYLKFKKSNRLFYKQLAIYLCNIRFELLRKFFFEDIENYSNDRKFFAEIYSLISNHINSLDSKEIDSVLLYVRNLRFERKNEIWTLTAQKYLLDLAKNNMTFSNNDYLALRESVENKINNNSLTESMKTMPSPLNMSKSMWMTSVGWNKSEDYKKGFKNLTNKDFCEKIKNLDLDNFDIYDGVFYSFLERIKNSGLIKYLKENDLISKFSFNEGKILIDAIADTNDIAFDKRVETIIEIVEINNDVSTKERLREHTFGVLYYLVKSIKNKENSILEHLFEFSLTANFFDRNDVWELKYDFFKNENALLNVKAFEWLIILLGSCQKSQWFKLRGKLLVAFEDINKKVIIKASLVSCIHEVWRLDSNYVKENIKKIFDNNFDGTNYSFAAFKLSMFCEADFINELFKNKILVPLLNDKNFGENTYYSGFMFSLYVKGHIENAIIEAILECDGAAEALVHLFNNFEQNFINDFSRDLVSSLFHLISSVNIIGRAELAGIKLLELSKIFNDVPYYVDAIVNLLSYKNVGVSSEKLVDIFKQCNLKQIDKENIIVAYFEHIDNPYLFIERNIDLIESFDWTNDEKKNSVINILGDKVPIYLSIANEKRKKK